MSVESYRRAFRRYVRIDCELVRVHDFVQIGDLALDLSTDGMLVRATRRVLTGEEVVVTFKPPRSNEWFDAVGVVSRVLHGRRPGDYGPSIGVEFTGLSDDARALLFRHLRGLAAPDPLRPPRSLVSPPSLVAVAA